jgi:hypothetical protein
MKRTRFLISAVLAVTVVAATWWWSQRGSGFATPEKCLAAFYQAAKDGDGPGYLSCLAEPLRTQQGDRFEDLSAYLLASTKDLKNWVQPAAAVITGSVAQIDMDERRPGSRQRVRYRLEKAGGWLIAGIGRPSELPEHVPYEMHIKDGELP